MSRDEDGARHPQLGLRFHVRILGAGGHSRELFGSTARIAGGKEGVGFGEARVIGEWGIARALAGLLKRSRRLEHLSLRTQTESANVERGAAGGAVAEHGK